jgi:hypothetical protein
MKAFEVVKANNGKDFKSIGQIKISPGDPGYYDA